MPFDPAQPATNSPNSSAVMRSQLNGLKELIDAVPAGPPGADGADGADGAPGPPFAQAVVDNVTTVNPDDPAQVAVSFDGTNVHFSFALPRGHTGNDGATGPPGPATFGAIVDGVTTLPAGENATVTVSFDGTNAHFSFALPRGANGSDGATGPQGAPGEVTGAQLTTAIATTSANSNGVATLDAPYSDPDLEAMRAKMNELILTLRR